MEKSLFHDSSTFAESEILDIYERHVDTVFRVSFSLTGNKQDAEDVTQSVFIKLLECGKTFVDHEHEKAWDHCRPEPVPGFAPQMAAESSRPPGSAPRRRQTGGREGRRRFGRQAAEIASIASTHPVFVLLRGV